MTSSLPTWLVVVFLQNCSVNIQNLPWIQHTMVGSRPSEYRCTSWTIVKIVKDVMPSWAGNGTTYLFNQADRKPTNNGYWESFLVAWWWKLKKMSPRSYVDNLSPIKQQRNTKSKTLQRKRRRSTTSKQSPHYQGTQDSTWFDNVPTSTGRGREIFIEENTRVTMRSLSQLSMMKF